MKFNKRWSIGMAFAFHVSMEKQKYHVPRLKLDDYISRTHGKQYVQHHLRFPQGENGIFIGTLSNFSRCYQKLPGSYMQDYYKIYCLTKGKMVKISQMRKVNLEDGAIHLSKPGQMKRWKKVHGTTGFYLMFSREFLGELNYRNNMLLEFPYLSPLHEAYFKLSSKDYAHTIYLMDKIHDEFSGKNKFAYEFIRLWTLELLLTLKRNYCCDSANDSVTRELSADVSQQFLEILERHFIEGFRQKLVDNKGVSEFAEQLHITASQLNKHLRKQLGKSAKTLIMDRYILAAKCKLVHTDLTISEICYILGFDNPPYFSRYFKRHTGMSPQECRDYFQQLL